MPAPKLRFQEFDGNWESNQLGKIIGISSASRVFKEQWQDSGVPFFRTSDVVSIFKNKENEKAYISLELFEELAKKSGKIHKDDLLVTGGGTIGIPYLVPNDQPLYFKDADLLWMKSSGIIEGSFLYNFLISPKFREYLNSISHTGTISHFTIEQAKATPFSFPSKEEQTKIASFLSAVDEKISQLSQKLHLLSQYKQGMMQKLFSQQLRFKADDGSEFGEWKTKKLEDIFSFSRGEPFSKTDISENGEFLCIHYGELFTKYKEVITNISSKTSLLAKNLGEIGDILMPSSDVTPDGLAKASCLNVSNVFLGGDINILRPQIPCSSEFFSYLINFEKHKVLLCVTGTTVKHVYNKDLKKIEYIYPCLEEQFKIANFLSSIDQKIDVVSEQLEQAKLWKKGLLQQMFV